MDGQPRPSGALPAAVPERAGTDLPEDVLEDLGGVTLVAGSELLGHADDIACLLDEVLDVVLRACASGLMVQRTK